MEHYKYVSQKGNSVKPSQKMFTSWVQAVAVLRNMCYGDGKLFVVKPSENSEILIVDARSGEKIGTVNTEGVSGGVFSVLLQLHR